MKLRKMLKTGLLTVCMIAMTAAQTGLQTVWAEKGGNEAEYTYTVTLYSGKEGTFSDGSDEIKITGLKYGDVVSLGQYIPSVSLKDADKYYVRGVRESGKDNNTVSNPAFKVESDREYVIAYGIKGNTTTYTVNYQDQNGKDLLPSETFYGVVGDKAVVAFRYVDGYRPQAYNLSKTLSSNTAENVLTFTYQKIAQNNGNNGNNGGNNTGNGDSNTPNDANNGGNANNTNGTTGNTTDTGTAAGTTTGNTNGTTSTTATDSTQNQTDTVTSSDSETPKDEINLDDEKTPLANKNLKKAKSRPAGMMYVLIAIAVAAIAALITLLIMMKKKDKKKREE